MRKQQSVCKIYYFPSLEGGGFEEVSTKEHQQPDDRCWQEKLMDIIGWSVVCVVIDASGSGILNQIIKWVAKWLGWWPS